MKFLKNLTNVLIVDLPKLLTDLKRIEDTADSFVHAKKNGVSHEPLEADDDRENITGRIKEAIKG